MAPPSTTRPSSTPQDLSGVVAYQEACAEVFSDLSAQPGTDGLSKGSGIGFSPEKIQANVEDKVGGDGQFRLFDTIQDPSGKDGVLACFGNFDIQRKNIGIFLFEPGRDGGAPLLTRKASLPWSNACAEAEEILGTRAFQSNVAECSDAPWSPQLEALSQEGQSLTLAKFADYCGEKLDQATGRNFSAEFSWDRVWVETRPGLSYLVLHFEDSAVGFYCEGVLSLQDHVLRLKSGKLKPNPNPDPLQRQLQPWIREESKNEVEFFLADDACTLGQDLGAQVSPSCQDQTGTGQWLDEAAVSHVGLLKFLGLTALGAATPLRRLLGHLPVLRSLEYFHNFRLPVFYNWRFLEGRPLLVRAGGQKILHTTYVQRLVAAWRSPVKPGHLAAKFLVRGLDVFSKTIGAAFLSAFIYDQSAAAVGIETDDTLRSVGTPVVGLTTLGVLAAHEMRQGAGVGAESALSRSIGTRFPAIKVAPRVHNGLVAVALLDLGVDFFLVGDDYDRHINHRATDAAYASDSQELAALAKYGFWGRVAEDLGETLMALRRTARWLAPEAIEWAVSAGNPQFEEALRHQDREACLKARQNLRDVLLPLAAMQNSEASFDFSFLYSKAEPVSKLFVQSLSSLGEAKTQKAFGLSDEAMAARLRQLALQNFQEAVAILHVIEIDTNDWARRFFKSDGALRYGQENALLEELFGPVDTWGPHQSAMKASVQASKTKREQAFFDDFLRQSPPDRVVAVK